MFHGEKESIRNENKGLKDKLLKTEVNARLRS